MTATPESFQTAWIANLKSKTQITSLLTNGGADEIREAEWQGTDFEYPNIRVGLDFFPSIEGCGPEDAEVHIAVFSAKKSSKEAAHIASTIFELYHKIPFSQSGITFSTVVVRRVNRPERDIYAWMAEVVIFVQGI